MAKSKSFKENFIANKENEKKLQKVLEAASAEEISEAINNNVVDTLGYTMWSSVIALTNDEEKLFEILQEVLPKLNRDQLSIKVLSDFYSRISMEISRFSLRFAVRLAYLSEANMQFGDVRASFFKDIIPCILQILGKDSSSSITIDGVTKSSHEYQQEIILGILSKPFKVSVLTSITSMFKDIPLDKPQTEVLLGKICENFANVHPSDISGLSLACFNLSLFNRLIIPVLALDTYFYNKRYKKKFIELDSEMDVNSIDEIAEKGIIETEENVIFHFQHVTEFTSIEKDIVNSLKPLSFAPKFIISPFIATVLVSFAKMSSSSVAGNLRLPQSILLPFIKQVFKNNERHRAILRQSAWARSVDQFEPVDIDKLLKILQENTCKLGQNVALNGFIGLTFMLLKTKNAPALNAFAVQFLSELVKQRPEFTSDIMKIVVKMLFSESNKGPIVECFSAMILSRSLAIDRCEDALKDLIENLTELELGTALAIESVIYNCINKSTKLRELMTNTMRTAMYQNKPGMRQLAVFSFCIMLKKVTKPSHNNYENFAPSQNISMLSLMSQFQLPSTGKANMRHVSVMVLEILGLLRKCFSHDADIRVTLYESLLTAVTANPFIISNVLELVEPYFRDYFDSENTELAVNFTKAFKQTVNGDLVVMDHVGKLLSFVVQCIEIANQKLLADGNEQTRTYKKFIEKLIDKIGDVTMEQLEIFSILNMKTSATIAQFLNCLEALMVYCLNQQMNATNILRIKTLFAKHQKVTSEAMKLQENSKKTLKKGKNQSAIPSAPKIDIKFDCIWDLKTCSEFLKLIFDDSPIEKLNEIKQNKELLRFVLKSLSKNISNLASAPEYLKIKHSKSTIDLVRNCSIILYRQLSFDRFTTLYDQFDEDSAVLVTETFKNIIHLMDAVYNTPIKWNDFLKLVAKANGRIDAMLGDVVKVFQKIVDWAFETDKEDVYAHPNGEAIVVNSFLTIELLIKNFQTFPNPQCQDVYNWMLKFCKETELTQKNFFLVNRIFFQIMIQQDSGNTLMEHISQKISAIYGSIDESLATPIDLSQNDLKSISVATVEQAFFHFANIIKKQIEDLEFCILRMNSFNAHIKIPGQDSRNVSINALSALELSTVAKLTQLGKVVGRLCNTRFNLRGTQIETIGRIGILFFTCLCNLMKHFCQHHNVKKLNFTQVPLETLMRETKGTVKQIYALSPYIEDQIECERTKKEQTSKKKPAQSKEFKYMSRLVLMVEKFATIVQKFDLATKKNFKKFLHTGDIRDFRIFRQQVPSSATTDAESEEDMEVDQEDFDTDSDEAPVNKKARGKRIQSSDDEDEVNDSDATDASHETPKPIEHDGYKKNLKIISKKAAKRK